MALITETLKKGLAEFPDQALELFIVESGKSLPQNPKEKIETLRAKREELSKDNEAIIRKPKITISQVIEDIKTLKQRFQTQTLTNDDYIGAFANIANKNVLYETYWRTNPNSIFYRLSGLTEHDGRNTLENFSSYIDFFVMDGYPENLGGDLENVTQESIAEGMDASINFYKVVEKALENEDSKISIEEFIDTFVTTQAAKKGSREFDLSLLLHGDKKIVFQGDWSEFDSFEEFISIRTIIHNALKEGDISEVKVSKDQDPATGKNIYTIVDNGPKGKNFLHLVELTVKSYEQGKKYPDVPGLISKGGARLAAFLAGQRGDEFYIDKELNTPKTIQIAFTKPKS